MSLYVVVLNVNPGLTVADVQSYMKGGATNSYYRIANNVWIVDADEDLGERYLFGLLSHLAKPSGTLFICRINARERKGFMSSKFWEWFKKRAING